MQKILIFAITLTFLSACQNYNRPSTSPEKMSGDTLCYRAAAAKENEAINDEIRARGLDCRKISADDPLLNMGRRY